MPRFQFGTIGAVARQVKPKRIEEDSDGGPPSSYSNYKRVDPFADLCLKLRFLSENGLFREISRPDTESTRMGTVSPTLSK